MNRSPRSDRSYLPSSNITSDSRAMEPLAGSTWADMLAAFRALDSDVMMRVRMPTSASIWFC